MIKKMKYYKINFQVKSNKKLETDEQFVSLRNRLKRKKFKEKKYHPDKDFEYLILKLLFKSKLLKKYEVNEFHIEKFKTKYCFIQGDVDCSFECNELGLDKVNLIIKWFNRVTKSECTFLGFNFKKELSDEDLEIQKIFATLDDPDFVSESEREYRSGQSELDRENKERMRIVRSHKRSDGLTKKQIMSRPFRVYSKN
jgi:hypothetical protein